MLIVNLLLFLLSLFVMVKSSEYCIRYSSRISKIFHLSEFVVSFFIVSVISVFPEASISIISAIEKVPEFGLGTLLGSNVADLALVFGIVALFSTTGIKVKSEILKKDFFYLALLSLPIILGFDGGFSRIDGLILILGGSFFFLTLSIESRMFRKKINSMPAGHLAKNIVLLAISLAILLLGANYTVKFGTAFASDIGVPSILIGLTAVAIGTCLPELIFSIRAVKTRHDELALGDILGTVITDATILVGVMALINPFSFDKLIIYVIGISMFLAGILTIMFIRTGRMLTKKEGIILIFFYILFLIVTFISKRLF